MYVCVNKRSHRREELILLGVVLSTPKVGVFRRFYFERRALCISCLVLTHPGRLDACGRSRGRAAEK